MRVVTGPKQQLETELRELAAGWMHFDDKPRAQEAVKALSELRAGSSVVRAGHCEFRVEGATVIGPLSP